MKVRRDFVTNSSSSSFIISKKYLDEDQIEAIREHRFLGEKLGLEYSDEPWYISENNNYITGDTFMDNFDMEEFLEKIGVKSKNVNWSEYPFSLPEDSREEDAESDTEEDSDWRRLLHEN